MRSIVVPTLFLFSVAVGALGCVHAGSRPESVGSELEPEPPTDAQITRLRHENSSLRRQVRDLQERLRFFEGRGAVTEAESAVERRLPVVRLAPPEGHTPPPERLREAVTLSPVPQPSPYEPEPEPEPEPAPGPVAASAPDWSHEPPAPTPASQPDDVKSYRLVGSRLVDLTKKRRPSAPKKIRSRRETHQQNGILAQYESAMSVYREGRYAEAEDAFAAFVRSHPAHDYAHNARYWKGEAAYDQSHYADALAAFTEVVERYGGGNKAPDALLKIGLCYGKLGDTANARDVLAQLVAAYPRAHATEIANRKLSEL